MRRWLLLLTVVVTGLACHDRPLPTQPPKKTSIGRAGGAVAGPNLDLVVAFPAGALTSATAITVDALPAVYDPHDRVIPGSAHELGPSGTTFARPVTLRMELNASLIPEGVSAEMLRIHELIGGEWVLLPEGYVDLAEGAVYANTEHFSTYALLPAALHSVDAGDEHACAIAAGEVWCWGSNSHQQLGTAVEEVSATPVRIASENLGTYEAEYTYCSASTPANVVCETRSRTAIQSALQVATGSHHTCARYPDSVYCWGGNFDGQIGNGEWGLPESPTNVLAGVQVNDIDAGITNTCAATDQGVLCWGSARQGILGLATGNEVCASTPCRTLPVAVLVGGAAPLAQVSVGLLNACAAFTQQGGQLTCWGDNRFGQIGSGSTSNSELPTTLGGFWSSVSVGVAYSCGLASGGDAWCWGQPYVPQALGLVSGGTSNVPQRVRGGQLFSSIAASDANYIFSHTCAIGRSDNSAYCWGSNVSGGLGVELAPDSCPAVIPQQEVFDCAAAPVRVATSATFRGISIGSGYTCADSHDGRVYCWGENASGQLGDGTFVTRRTPAAVAS